MEKAVLKSIPKLVTRLDLFKFIGAKFEESGLCSLDTIKILKDTYSQAENEGNF